MYRSGSTKPTYSDLVFEQSLEEYNRVKQLFISKLKAKYGKEVVNRWLRNSN